MKTGILTRAREVKISQEEATLYEQINLIIVEALAQNKLTTSDQQQTQSYISQRFSKEKVKANISTYGEGYIISYGIYTQKILLLDADLNELNTALAVVGKSNEWEYIINDDNSATLTVYKKNISGNFDIPNIIDNHLVTALGDDLFNYATKMTNMTLPDGLITIGARTFQGCSNLEWNVKFPSTLTTVGDNAFSGCNKINGNLDEIMKYNVKYGKGVFMRCSSLTGDIATLIGMLDENETVISESLFSGFSGATGNLIIPARITKIEDNAFYGCSGLNSVTFESNDNLQSIGNYAFYQCSGLGETLDLPDSVKSIGEYSFSENEGITGLDLPNSLETMGQCSFYRCSNLVGPVSIPSGLKVLETGMFQKCNKLSSVTFNSNNNGVTEIGSSAFSSCSNLENLILSGTLTKIDFYAFYDCQSLTNIFLPDSLITIDSGAFQNCVNIDITHWSENLTSIGDHTFSSCLKLSTIPNKNKLLSIKQSSFEGCTLLGSSGENNIISWLSESNINELGSDCFKNCKHLTGDFLGSIKNKKNNEIKLNGSPFVGTNIKFAKVLNLDGKTSISTNEYAGVTKFLDVSGNEITTLNIPDTITIIGNYAFSGCSSLVNINVSNNVTSIGIGAFQNCTSLSHIDLPQNSSYTILSYYLLNGCSNLKSIEIPKYITLIQDNALANCDFETLNIPGNVKIIKGGSLANSYNLKSITLNEGTEYFGSQFLRGAAITEIVFPNSAIQLDESVLHYCPKLKKITLGKNITKIPKDMLYVTNQVEEIIIKGNITEIGANAFADIPTLKKLDMNWSSIAKIESKAFYNCPALTGNIKLNSSCSIAEDAFLGCSLNISK